MLNSIRPREDLKGKCVAIFTHGDPMKVAYTLSVNPGSMDNPSRLKDTLKKFPKVDDPKPCQVVLYHANDMDFNCAGELDLDADDIQLKTYSSVKP